MTHKIAKYAICNLLGIVIFTGESEFSHRKVFVTANFTLQKIHVRQHSCVQFSTMVLEHLSDVTTMKTHFQAEGNFTVIRK